MPCLRPTGKNRVPIGPIVVGERQAQCRPSLDGERELPLQIISGTVKDMTHLTAPNYLGRGA